MLNMNHGLTTTKAQKVCETIGPPKRGKNYVG